MKMPIPDLIAVTWMLLLFGAGLLGSAGVMLAFGVIGIIGGFLAMRRTRRPLIMVATIAVAVATVALAAMQLILDRVR
jgi:hypothetical protein